MSPSLLFSPMTIRSLTLRNRIVLSPMLTYAATHGHVNDWHFAHLAKYAVGGVGLVFVESTKVDPRGCSTSRDLGLWKDAFVPGLRRITDFLHSQGAAAGIQLAHSGRKARTSVPWEGRVPLDDLPGVEAGETWELIAPSAVPHGSGFATPSEMSADDIAAQLIAWGQAARRAREAGFDVLEIHGAHGYLIHQFLSPCANQRTDQWGGSLCNRMRFALQVVDAVRAHWPADRPLFFRLSAVDDEGWTLDDSTVLTHALREHGVDVIDCSSGGMTAHRMSLDGATPLPLGYQVPYSASLRQATGMTTMAVGLIIHANQAEQILREGKADLIALGRELLHNPHWVMDAAEKLGIAQPRSMVPPAYGWWLERRDRDGLARASSTWAAVQR